MSSHSKRSLLLDENEQQQAVEQPNADFSEIGGPFCLLRLDSVRRKGLAVELHYRVKCSIGGTQQLSSDAPESLVIKRGRTESSSLSYTRCRVFEDEGCAETGCSHLKSQKERQTLFIASDWPLTLTSKIYSLDEDFEAPEKSGYMPLRLRQEVLNRVSKIEQRATEGCGYKQKYTAFLPAASEGYKVVLVDVLDWNGQDVLLCAVKVRDPAELELALLSVLQSLRTSTSIREVLTTIRAALPAAGADLVLFYRISYSHLGRVLSTPSWLDFLDLAQQFQHAIARSQTKPLSGYRAGCCPLKSADSSLENVLVSANSPLDLYNCLTEGSQEMVMVTLQKVADSCTTVAHDRLLGGEWLWSRPNLTGSFCLGIGRTTAAVEFDDVFGIAEGVPLAVTKVGQITRISKTERWEMNFDSDALASFRLNHIEAANDARRRQHRAPLGFCLMISPQWQAEWSV